MRYLGLGSVALIVAACAARAEVAPVVSYQADIVPLLEGNCATCHLTGEEAGGMSLVGDAAIASLVDKPAQGAPAILRIAPGDPDRSYIVMKLEGTHIAHGGSGARMPFGGPPLAPTQITKIRNWIAAGANP